MGMSLTVGLSFFASFEATTSYESSTSVGSSMEKSFSTAKSKEGSTTRSYSHPHPSLAFWQFQYHVSDTCNLGTTILTSAYAYSYSKHHIPRCLPGFCDAQSDAKGRCCSCKATSDGVDPTMPGSEECIEEEWDTCGSETRVPVVLGGATQVGPPSEISAGSS